MKALNNLLMKARRRKLPKNEIIDYPKVLVFMQMIDLFEKETGHKITDVDILKNRA